MSAITPVQDTRKSDGDLARKMMFPDATEEELRLALLICNKYGLDPLLRHVVLIKQRERDGQPAKRNLYVTRDGLLHVAHVSGKLDGIVLEKQEETPAEWRAVISVYRKDMTRPFTYPGRYPKSGSNARYGPEMAVKVAEVMALRRAFDVALPAQEERTDLEEEGATVEGFQPEPPETSNGTALQRLETAMTRTGTTEAQALQTARKLFGSATQKIRLLADLSDEQISQLIGEIEVKS